MKRMMHIILLICLASMRLMAGCPIARQVVDNSVMNEFGQESQITASEIYKYLGTSVTGRNIRITSALYFNGYIFVYYSSPLSTGIVTDHLVGKDGYAIVIYSVKRQKFVYSIEMEASAEGTYGYRNKTIYFIADGIVFSIDTEQDGKLIDRGYKRIYCDGYKFCSAASIVDNKFIVIRYGDQSDFMNKTKYIQIDGLVPDEKYTSVVEIK